MILQTKQTRNNAGFLLEESEMRKPKPIRQRLVTIAVPAQFENTFQQMSERALKAISIGFIFDDRSLTREQYSALRRTARLVWHWQGMNDSAPLCLRAFIKRLNPASEWDLDPRSVRLRRKIRALEIESNPDLDDIPF